MEKEQGQGNDMGMDVPMTSPHHKQTGDMGIHKEQFVGIQVRPIEHDWHKLMLSPNHN